jgi:hypothetical protein
MAFTYAAVGLTAVAMAAFRRSLRLAQVLIRVKIELLFALGAAEVIRLPLVIGMSSGGSRVHVHAAHGVFHGGCVIHLYLSFVREFWFDVSSNIDWPISVTRHVLPLPRKGIT